jgi:hypothetical protein
MQCPVYDEDGHMRLTIKSDALLAVLICKFKAAAVE